MKQSKKTASLSDFKSFKDMINHVYGKDEVKDDSKKPKAKGRKSTERGSGTAVASEVDKGQLEAQEVCHQDEQRGQADSHTRSQFEVDGFKGRC